MDTIRELFYGNIHPYERDVPKDSEGDKLNKLIIRHDSGKAQGRFDRAKQLVRVRGFRQRIPLGSEIDGGGTIRRVIKKQPQVKAFS